MRSNLLWSGSVELELHYSRPAFQSKVALQRTDEAVAMFVTPATYQQPRSSARLAHCPVWLAYNPKQQVLPDEHELFRSLMFVLKFRQMLRFCTSGCSSTVEPRCAFLANRTAGWNRRRLSSLAAVSRQDDVVVIGGGAAGLTAAYFAAEKGAKVSSPAGCHCRGSTPITVQLAVCTFVI